MPTLAAVADAVRGTRADLLVLDIAAPEGVGEALEVLVTAALEMLVAVLADPALLVDRVEVAWRGGRAFLPRDAAISDLRRDATILAVDDDPRCATRSRSCSGGRAANRAVRGSHCVLGRAGAHPPGKPFAVDVLLQRIRAALAA